MIAGVIRPCSICRSSVSPAFSAKVLNRYEAQYDLCDDCGFMRVREPQWVDEAYSSAIAITDTGLLVRNIAYSRKLASLLYWIFKGGAEKKFLDAAAGYGTLVRLMRDSGFDFYWEDKYCENLLARGFEYQRELGPCAAVTALEVMEHIEDPLTFVRESMTAVDADTFIFSTVLFEGSPPPRDWWYYSFETGQHLSFFQRRTIERMAGELGMSFTSGGGLHAFSKRPISSVMFRLFAGPLSGFVSQLAHRRLGSRTMTDHEAMVRRLRALPQPRAT